MVEGGRGEIRSCLAAGQLVEQRAEADLVEPTAELVQAGQFPRGVLVGGQRGEPVFQPVVGERKAGTQLCQLLLAVLLQGLQVLQAGRQPGRTAAAGLAGAEFLPLGELVRLPARASAASSSRESSSRSPALPAAPTSSARACLRSRWPSRRPRPLRSPVALASWSGRAAKTSAEKMLRVLAMAAYRRIRLLPSA